MSIKVARKLNSTDVINTLLDLFILKGVADYIRSDNGSEFPEELVHRLAAAADLCDADRIDQIIALVYDGIEVCNSGDARADNLTIGAGAPDKSISLVTLMIPATCRKKYRASSAIHGDCVAMDRTGGDY